MKVTAIAVMSLDGKITRWDEDDIHHWSSDEDFKHFLSYRDKADAVIMGRKMFDLLRETVQLNIKACRFVMTKYRMGLKDQDVPGKLEFTELTPDKLLKECRKRGYTNILLVGGSQIFSAFAKQGLIDEFLITIEPRIFGNGHPLVVGQFDLELSLLSKQELNNRGTLLLHYKVKKIR